MQNESRKKRFWVCGLGLFFILAMAFAGYHFYDQFLSEQTQKLGRPIYRCPMGHRVNAVPVIYGLLVMDDELRNKFDEGEFVSGGCILDSDSPKYNGLCPTCGYQYDPRFNIWSRRTESIDGYAVPFSPLIHYFKIGNEGTDYYCQETREGKTLSQRYCWYSKSGDSPKYADLQAMIETYIKEKHIRGIIKDYPRQPDYHWREYDENYPSDMGITSTTLMVHYNWTVGNIYQCVYLVWDKNRPYVSLDIHVDGPEDLIPEKGPIAEWLDENLGLDSRYEKLGIKF